MFWWIFVCFFTVLGVSHLVKFVYQLIKNISIQKEHEKYDAVLRLLVRIKDYLKSGWVPPDEVWDSLKNLPHPWGLMCAQSFYELRSKGSPVLPTVYRMEALVNIQKSALINAKTQTSQAYAQALLCSSLIPFLAIFFTLQFPEVLEQSYYWFGCCTIALMLGLSAAIWMIQLSLQARYAGLRGKKRDWMIIVPCGVERLLALIRSGCSLDDAWLTCVQFIQQFDVVLAEKWGYSIWTNTENAIICAPLTAEHAIDQVSQEIKKAVYIALMEGRPCLEKIENAAIAFQEQLKAKIAKQIQLLPLRALKPLFLLVAPGVFSLIGFVLYALLTNVME